MKIKYIFLFSEEKKSDNNEVRTLYNFLFATILKIVEIFCSLI